MDMENIDIEIRWIGRNKGQMCIRLKEFIGMHNISKFRKLLKIIRESDNPDEEQKIAEWFSQFNEYFEPNWKDAIRRQIEKRENIESCQLQVNTLVYNRDRFKKNTPPYKHYAALLKEKKKELSSLKVAYRQALQDEKKIMADKKFIKKCLEIME